MKPRRRLLTIGHSYVVGLNRRLAHEMARVGADDWDVVTAAPTYFHGANDLRPVTLETIGEEPSALRSLPAYQTNRVHLFRYSRALKPLLQENWDMVHAWEEPFILAGWQIARNVPKQTKYVFATFQNLTKNYPPPFRWFESACLRRSSGWIAFGETIRATLEHRKGYKDRPFRVLSPGVDVERYAPSAASRTAVHNELGWTSAGPPVIGYLGRFIPEKGLDTLTTALDGLQTPWRALFIGAGPLEADLRKWADRYGDRVRFRTDVKHDQVPEQLCAMDILCAPSRTTARWREQFGRMLIEGLATGLSVLGSDSGEIPFVLGDAGRILPENQPDAWRDALAELLESPTLRKELGEHGRHRALQRFAWPVVARNHLDFFEELLAQPKSSL